MITFACMEKMSAKDVGALGGVFRFGSLRCYVIGEDEKVSFF